MNESDKVSNLPADQGEQQQQKSPDQPVVVAEQVVVQSLGVGVAQDQEGHEEEEQHPPEGFHAHHQHHCPASQESQ